jgi:TRAP-type C4-dicarboxylate transport system permease large subunit
MNKQDIKVGMLVKSSLYASVLPPSVGMVIAYPGIDWRLCRLF